VTRPVSFVGPLPPPLHGFSSVCSMMLLRLRSGGAVAVFDRAPRAGNRAREMLRQLREVTRYFAAIQASTHAAVYLGLSGGLGQAIDGLYVLLARLLRRQLFVHHHSFSYLNRATPLNRLLFSQMRAATHIVLSEGMGSALAQRYRIRDIDIRVVSNAAFLGVPMPPLPPPSAPTRSESPAAIRIGFLSNITFEKGIVEFFDVLTQLRRLGVRYRGSIAGPVAADAQSTFERLLAAAENVEYLGPLYDDTKAGFYQRLDVLLFPTKYQNEAEPLVIHEALRSAVPVLACARGAIAELLSNGAGMVFEQGAFVMSAANALNALSQDRPELARLRQLAFAQAQRMQLRAEAQLTEVIRQILQ